MDCFDISRLSKCWMRDAHDVVGDGPCASRAIQH